MSQLQYPDGTSFVVRGRDSPSSIASKFGISLGLLLEANPWMHGMTEVGPGSTVFVPFPPPPACHEGMLVKVEPGDTLFTIAKRYGTGIEDIIKANPQVFDPNILHVGQTVCVLLPPPPPAVCKNGTIVTVGHGDTLYEIASRYGVTLKAILKANPQVRDPNRIMPEQQICVPFPPPPPCPCGSLVILGKGESLETIASRYSVSVQDLLNVNPDIKDQRVIRSGQVICVPATTETTEKSGLLPTNG